MAGRLLDSAASSAKLSHADGWAAQSLGAFIAVGESWQERRRGLAFAWCTCGGNSCTEVWKAFKAAARAAGEGKAGAVAALVWQRSGKLKAEAIRCTDRAALVQRLQLSVPMRSTQTFGCCARWRSCPPVSRDALPHRRQWVSRRARNCETEAPSRPKNETPRLETQWKTPFATMGIFFRDREADQADPDLRASRYFLFKNKQSAENKLRTAEKKYGYTLGELHAYKHVMRLPKMPEAMEMERQDLQHTYQQVEKLVASNADGGEAGALGGPTDAAVDESCVKCLGYYLALDRCVRTVSKEDEKNRIYKHTRLHACKPHWVWFNRCVGYRDQQLLKEISSWEAEHMKTLDNQQRQAYMDKLLGAKRYLEYTSARSRDDVEIVNLEAALGTAFSWPLDCSIARLVFQTQPLPLLEAVALWLPFGLGEQRPHESLKKGVRRRSATVLRRLLPFVEWVQHCPNKIPRAAECELTALCGSGKRNAAAGACRPALDGLPLCTN
ncbi:hypothetical protein cyc_01862 [Cyclospora cayetanensis]|uniref:Uncharacterized protein n=1 Tax=Cyclospora cayetanensis TaxID=88456 RepID=A0A1D3D6G1_9EIME|nr:hypothetical protein cyc_01862 [Cyclospora cayetanensis]